MMFSTFLKALVLSECVYTLASMDNAKLYEAI